MNNKTKTVRRKGSVAKISPNKNPSNNVECLPRAVKARRTPYPYFLDYIQFGFEWGPAKVLRIISDDHYGVLLRVESRGYIVDIRVKPAGAILVGKVTKKR